MPQLLPPLPLGDDWYDDLLGIPAVVWAVHPLGSHFLLYKELALHELLDLWNDAGYRGLA